jgi:CRISPR/Cas system-associated exonuclease Cas4 (RecB family)
MAHVEELISQIQKIRIRELEKKISRYPRRNVYLSDIGECDRQIVYGVLDWDKRPLHDVKLQARFDVGNLWEREIIRELEGMSFKVILSQQSVEVKSKDSEVIAVGRIDGFIEGAERRKFPLEIKSMNPLVYKQVSSFQDLQRYPHLRKYSRQLLMYMFGTNNEEGLMILTDCLGGWKFIPVYLDYGECEKILQRLESVNKFIKTRKYPVRIAYDGRICDKCPFSHICLQDIITKEPEEVTNPEFEDDISRHEELKPLSTEYNYLHRKIKDTVGRSEKLIVGARWLIQQVETQRTIYDVPVDKKEEIDEAIKAIKNQFGKKVNALIMSITDLDAKTKDEN